MGGGIMDSLWSSLGFGCTCSDDDVPAAPEEGTQVALGTPVTDLGAPMKSAPSEPDIKGEKAEPQHLGIVVDRSGSMQSMRAELVDGLNVFIGEQKKTSGEQGIPTRVSVIEFDNKIETLVDDVPIDQVPTFDCSHFVPRGMTALLDGIGRMISMLEDRVPFGRLPVQTAPIVVILTDGMENASQEFSRSRLFDLITAKRELGWKFTFMGANQDAIAVGQSYGFSGGSCVTYAATGRTQTSAWHSASAQVTRTRCGESEDFSMEERFACG